LTEKFTYFDFLMYVLPGTVILSGLLVGWAIAGGEVPTLLGDSGLFASVVFILAAFVLGHFVQTVAHSLPEKLLKRLFWAGRYPSQILFFKGHRLVSGTERERHIAMLREVGLASDEVVKVWDGELTIGWFRGSVKGIDKGQFAQGTEGAQFAFNRIRNHLTDQKAGIRASSAEAYYQFFRGGFTGAGLTAMALALEIVALRHGWLTPFDGAVDITGLGTMVVSVYVLLAVAFFWRARGAGQNFARETFRAYAALRKENRLAKEQG
jgi:hypothetical protein